MSFTRMFGVGALSALLAIGCSEPGGGGTGGGGTAGGGGSGQVIREVKAFEPRTWSVLHLFEGGEPRCAGAVVENNEFGPAGQSDGTWADGISFACANSIVRNNTIVDATDGAIIRIGLGMGWRVWVCFDPASTEDPTIYGAEVTDNMLMGDHMQYGFVVDGVRDWTVTGNVDLATHSGTPTIDCNGQVASPPAGFQFHSARAQGTFQPEFTEASLELALWAIEDPP